MILYYYNNINITQYIMLLFFKSQLTLQYDKRKYKYYCENIDWQIISGHRFYRIYNDLLLNLILTQIITSDLLSDELQYSARSIPELLSRGFSYS